MDIEHIYLVMDTVERAGDVKSEVESAEQEIIGGGEPAQHLMKSSTSQENISGGADGRGRKRRRGRGRGRGQGRDTMEHTLLLEQIQVRTERAIRKCRRKALSAQVKKEFVSRKGQVELQPVLLPGAPPRKTQRRRPSPDREACPMMDHELPLRPDAVEDEPQPSVAAEDEPVPEPKPEPDFFADKGEFIMGQQVVMETQPSTSQSISHSTSMNVNNKNFETTIDTWILSDDSDVDLDIDLDTHASPLPDMRNAAAEPACETDMTELQTQVLQTEDELNDRVLREMVTNDDYYHFDWKKDSTTFTGRRETFTEPSGPTFDVTGKTAVDVFYKMFDTDFMDRLCTETNRYAEQTLASFNVENKLLSKSRLNRWTPTNRDEMVTFMAVLILQGLYPLPEEEKYFSFNGFGTMPYFSRIISYNRFVLLKRLYHFVDNQTLTDRSNKLCKIEPVLDYLNDKFSTLYMPSQEIFIDESLLKWHGRLSFAQKIATKAAQVGVKTYELCESRTGYLWKFFVYVGAKTRTGLTAPTNDRHTDVETLDQPDVKTINQPDVETIDRLDGGVPRPTNATAKIVFNLVEPLLDCGHTVIMDNFYNSPLLLRCLKRQKTDCYGTLRLNRNFVPDSLKTLTKNNLRQGEAVASYTSDLSVMVWRDANLVSLISTYHHLQAGVQNKHNRLTYKPKVVLDYNKFMGGVDRKDQFLSAHPMERTRNKVWYKKVFCRLLNTAVFNAFIIFSTQNPKITHRQFRVILAEGLLKIHRRVDLTTEPRMQANRNRQLTTQAAPQPVAVDHDHFPARSSHPKGVCRMCSQMKRSTRTIWKCLECNVNLCIEHCFRLYHKRKLY